MSFMVSPTLVDVEVNYMEDENGELYILEEDKEKEFEGKYKTAKAKFKRSNQKSFTQYISNCTIVKNDIPMIDQVLLRDNKFKVLLVELIDGDGEKVELNKYFFDNVSPDLVSGLIEKYDNSILTDRINFLKKTGIIEEKKEEEKKEETVKKDTD